MIRPPLIRDVGDLFQYDARRAFAEVTSKLETLSNVFTDTVAGLVPPPGSAGTTKFLRQDRTWQVPPGGGGGVTDGDKGDIVVSGGGATFTIDSGVVTTAKMGGDVTTAGKALLDDTDATAQRSTLGLGTAATQPSTAFATASHSHPESDITGLVADLASKVPTTRTLGVTSPITGGGDLTADRSFGFDQAVVLNNNARITVRKNTGADVGARRRLNLVEGTNVTLTVADDAANEEVDITISASGGGGSADAKPATLALGSIPRMNHKITVTDAAVSAANQILVSWGTTLDTDVNGPDMDTVTFAARPGSGNFDVLVNSDGLIAGDVKINYLVG